MQEKVPEPGQFVYLCFCMTLQPENYEVVFFVWWVGWLVQLQFLAPVVFFKQLNGCSF